MTLARTLAAALAAAALAAPTALAQPADIHAPLIKPAAEANTQDHTARPDTAGNPNVAAATEANTHDHAARPDTAGNPNVAAATGAALAEERYYASHGKPTPLTEAGSAVATDTGNGITTLPFVIAVVGALLVGLGAGSALHLMHVRRHASGLAT